MKQKIFVFVRFAANRLTVGKNQMRNLANWVMILYMTSPLYLPAQTSTINLLIETDPISTVLGARTLSIIIEPNDLEHWSFFGNIVTADFPTWMDNFLNPNNKGKGLTSKIKIGAGLAVDYFLDANRRGLYGGLLQLFFRNQISLLGVKGNITTYNLIPRIGYRWFAFGGNRLCINPFLGVRYEHAMGRTLVLLHETFQPAGWQPFATIHVGFRL